MTCEEVRRELHLILIKMADYEWKTARDKLNELYCKLNETPYDITRGYNHDYQNFFSEWLNDADDDNSGSS
jgi:hypothetical protein